MSTGGPISLFSDAMAAKNIVQVVGIRRQSKWYDDYNLNGEMMIIEIV